MNKKISEIALQSLELKTISKDDAHFLLQREGDEIFDVLYWANTIRRKHFGRTIKLCSIVSAKQGRCTEDCSFCSQSARFQTDIEAFPLVENDKIFHIAKSAEQTGSKSIGIVTSGYTMSNSSEFTEMRNTIRNISKNACIHPHGSFGVLTEKMAKDLVDSGLKRINHNLETSERFFPNICTSHTYADRLNTIHAAKKAGLEICSGAIFGVGEEAEDRVDLLFALKELEADVVPLNFLHAVSGTPLGHQTSLPPMEILKIIAVSRFILPDTEIKLAGGRESNLRSLQSWMFYAGANSTMIGNYLTTKGKKGEEDLQMIKDLGLEVEF